MEEQQPEEIQEEKPLKKGLSLKKMVIHILIILVIGLVITLGFFYIYLPTKTNHGETITVPNLIERHVDELEEMLVQRNLRYEVNDSAYSSQYPPFTILQQYPAPGSKVKEGRKIFISINRKSVPVISFPDGLFSGEKSLTHVKAVLSNLDIDIERTLVRKGPYFNLVLEARYEGEPIEDGDQIPKGASVTLIVADGYGETSFELPSFFGMEYNDAEVLRKGLDLNLEPLIIPRGVDTTGQVVYVVRQTPDPGSVVRLGEMLTFWVDIEMDSSYYYELYPDTTSKVLDVMDTVSINLDSAAASDDN